MPQNYSDYIDIFTHILPEKYGAALERQASYSIHNDLNAGVTGLSRLDDRFRMLDSFRGMRQVLTLAQPALEYVVDPGTAVGLAKLANDEMAELVAKHPESFAAAVACLPMNDIDAALKETERAIEELGFKGVQIITPVNGKPMDSPEFMEIYGLMSRYDLPIWIHPTREPSVPDYPGEDASKYNIFSSIGWPYETTLAMARLVFSGVFDKYPGIKFITHHAGGMVPFFAPRIVRRPRPWLEKPPEEYFKSFYVDTELRGYLPGLLCSHAFFGEDHMLFGTDTPFTGETGIAENVAGMAALDLSEAAKKKITAGNARRLLHLAK